MRNKRKYIVCTNKDVNWDMFTNGIRHKELPQSKRVIWLLARTILSNSSLIQFVHKRWTGCTDWQIQSEKGKRLIGLSLVVVLSRLIIDTAVSLVFVIQLITARIRRMRKGNIFSLFTLGGGGTTIQQYSPVWGSPIQSNGQGTPIQSHRGVSHSAQQGSTPIQPDGGYFHLVLTGGMPARSGWGFPPPPTIGTGWGYPPSPGDRAAEAIYYGISESWKYYTCTWLRLK